MDIGSANSGLSSEAAALFWFLRHILGVVSNNLGKWVTLGDFAGWAIPIKVSRAKVPFGPRHEASFFITSLRCSETAAY